MEFNVLNGLKFKDDIVVLFNEYTDYLVENDNKFKEYLSIQNYDREINLLEEKYGEPYGRLYLVKSGNTAVGCIALKKIDKENCELKRLYIRKEFRKNGIAKHLVNIIIRDAENIGYKYILLDTLPFLKEAIELYKSYGFYEIEKYNNNPIDNSIYMKYDIKKEKK